MYFFKTNFYCYVIAIIWREVPYISPYSSLILLFLKITIEYMGSTCGTHMTHNLMIILKNRKMRRKKNSKKEIKHFPYLAVYII